MKGNSELIFLLSLTSSASQCSCFSLQPHSRHFGIIRTTALRNSIGSDDLNQSLGSNYARSNNGYLDSLSAAYATDLNDEDEENDGDLKQPSTDWKDPFSTASSAFSDVVRTGKNDIQSAANAATSGIGAAANAATSGIGAAANAATSGIGAAANAATSGIGAAAQKGTSDFQALANSATSNAKRSAVRVRSFARKGNRKVGAVATWIDSQAKLGTQAIGSQARSMVVKFTGKEDYEFGDIVKETIRRILSGDVSVSDTILLLKILLAIGATIGPLAELLPVAVLMQGLNVSIETKIGGKIIEALAHSLDNRFVAAFTGDDKFLLGSAAKRTMLEGILAFTGKSTYEAGDIQRAVEADPNHEKLEMAVDPELEAWDKAFTESIEMQKQREQVALLYSNPDGTPLDDEAAKELDMELAAELEEWSSVFRKDYADFGL